MQPNETGDQQGRNQNETTHGGTPFRCMRESKKHGDHGASAPSTGRTPLPLLFPTGDFRYPLDTACEVMSGNPNPSA